MWSGPPSRTGQAGKWRKKGKERFKKKKEGQALALETLTLDVAWYNM